ncbi:MAG: polysaccharide deacetylase family protein [Eubacteriales bacterium]|nr:polysaccharide deacetylase family protein [Eubacteriales bacterium]MDD3882065.1 polysaccharide deacetylase family protein [Eubacteriales bacterium]MDD4512512.1 polysaccharide deacetylase family protein [Eubacteriales bacterium]
MEKTNEKKLVALTFDDGPNTVTTPLVLEKLEKHGVIASFFLIANNISEESAKVAKQAFQMGCEINNHSKTHSDMTKLSGEQVKAELQYTTEKIIGITGKAPRFFRPPFILYNQTMFDSTDMTFISGVGAMDWVPEVTSAERAAKIIAQVRNGTVILLHDMTGNQNTVDALDTIIPALKDDGYEFVTVSDLFDKLEVKPKHGVIYSNVFQD